MVNDVLLYIGSGIIIFWGIAHIVPTWSVVKGFGDISPHNRRIITMEWLAEGLTLMFIGVLVVLITFYYDPTNVISQLAYRVCAGMLVLLALLTLLTGFRTKFIPMKLCPAVKILAATFLILGSAL
jgi:hypothetical protein